VLIGALVATFAAIAPSAPAGAAPYCGITWGSLGKSSSPYSQNPMTNLRAGQHACYDRLVVDLRGTARTGYWAAYGPRVTDDGSGETIPLRGGAFLTLLVHAPGYDSLGRPTYRPPVRSEAVNVSGFRTLRQVHYAGTFEGRTLIGIGVRARLPFRVFTLTGPGNQTRIVLDVAHRW
jgi:hypothetical protein